MASRTTLLKILSDATGAKKDISELNADVKKFGSHSAEAVVKIKTEAAQAQIKKLDDRLRHLGQQKQTPEVKIATARALKQLERVQHEYAQIGVAGEKASAKASAGFGSLGDKLREHRKNLVGLATAAVGVSAAVSAVTGVGAALDTTEQLATATIGLARNFGLTADQASRWAAVAHSREVDPTSLHMGFTSLSRAVEKAASGTKGAMDAFHKLGITQDEVRRGQKDFPFLLDRVSKGFTNLHGGTQRAALAQQLFGRGSKGLLPLLRSGSLGFEAQAKMAQKYGATLSGKTLREQEKFVASQRESRVAMLGLQVSVAGLAPALTSATDRLSRFLRQVRDGTGAGGRFARAMRQIINPIRSIVNFLGRHPHVIQAAIAAWALYKAAAIAALAISRVRLIRMFTGLAPRAAAGGAEAGAAYGAGFGAAAGVAMTAGVALALSAIAVEANSWLKQQPWYKPPGGKGGFFDSLIPDSLLPKDWQHPNGPLAKLLGLDNPAKPGDVAGNVPAGSGIAFGRHPGRTGGGSSGGSSPADVPLPSTSGAQQRALKVSYDQAVKEYQHQVRLHGANSGAAIQALAAVGDARDAMNAPGIAADKKAEADRKARQRKEEAARRREEARRRREARLRRPATAGTQDALRAAHRRDRYEEIVAEHGADSPEAKRELARDRVANARDTVKTDKGILADAVRRFGASSDKAVKAHTRLVDAQAKLTKATGQLTHAVAKTCNGALIPRATDVARHAGIPSSVRSGGFGGAHLGHRTWGDVFVDKLVMPQSAAPTGDPRYDAVKTHRHLRAMGAALPA